MPAYRVDRFSGRTHLVNGVSGRLQDYGTIGQPKLSIIHTLGQTTHVYANWGRTFQVLTGSTAPAYLTPGRHRCSRPPTPAWSWA